MHNIFSTQQEDRAVQIPKTPRIKAIKAEEEDLLELEESDFLLEAA